MRKFCLFLFVCFACCIKLNAQGYSFTREEGDRFNSLYHNSVLFYNGNRPFQENGLWGIKTETGEVVVAAKYDSILNGGFNHCLVVDKSGYNVLDSIGRPCFKKNETKISVYGNQLTIPRNGINYQYLVYRLGLTPMTAYDGNFIEFPRVVKEQQTKTIDPSIEYVWMRYYQQGTLVDSIHQYMKGGNYTKKVIFLHNGETRTVPSKNWGGVLGDNYMKLYMSDENPVKIVDIRTGDTVLQGEFNVDMFEHNGSQYFLAQSKNLDSAFFYNLDGTLVVAINKRFANDDGLLVERVPIPKSKLSNYNVYAFPNFDTLEFEVRVVEKRERYQLFANYKKEFYSLYHKDKKIATFPILKNEKIEMDQFYRDTKGSFIQITLLNTKNGASKKMIFREDGKLLLETPYDEEDKYIGWRSDYQQLDYVYDEKSISIYRLHDDLFRPLPAGYAFENQIGEDAFEVITEGKIFIQNLAGEKLYFPKGFDNIETLRFMENPFYKISWDDSSQVYNHLMQPLLEVVDIYPIPQYALNNNVSFSPFALAKRAGEHRFFIIDAEGRRLSDKYFLAIYEFRDMDHFIVLNEANEIEYIPISNLK